MLSITTHSLMLAAVVSLAVAPVWLQDHWDFTNNTDLTTNLAVITLLQSINTTLIAIIGLGCDQGYLGVQGN